MKPRKRSRRTLAGPTDSAAVLLRVYDIARSDEHHLRDIFYKRIAYYTTIVLAAVAGIAAIAKDTSTVASLTMMLMLSLLMTLMALHSRTALDRIHQHFIESIEVREFCEVRLGLRSHQATSTSDYAGLLGSAQPVSASAWWSGAPVFLGSWAARRPGHNHYDRIRRIFGIFALAGAVASAGFAWWLAKMTGLLGIFCC